jgi:Skp family chaperone for outer membrane proteins
MKSVTKKAWMIVAAAVLMIGVAVLKDSWAQTRPAADAPAPATTRVAVVDVVKVFANYQRAKDQELRLQEHRKEVKAENEKRSKNIESMELELKDALAPGSPEFQKRLDELTKASIDRETWLKFEDAKETQERYRLSDEMYKDILKTVAEVAKDQNFQIVISSDESNAESKPDVFRKIERKKVLYAAPGLDITDSVLTKINDAYKAGKK